MQLPSDVIPNEHGEIGLFCECEVGGDRRDAGLDNFSVSVYQTNLEEDVRAIAEFDLQSGLRCPNLRLVKFTPVSGH